MIPHVYTRTADGARLELRAFGASVGAVVERHDPCIGACAQVFADARGGALSVAAWRWGAGVYGAARPLNWVEWEVWKASKNRAKGRKVMVVGSARGMLWSLWTRAEDTFDDRAYNTLREGAGSWARVAFGRLIEETICYESRKASVTLDEGIYEVTASVEVRSLRRPRWPVPTITRSTMVWPTTPIALPFVEPVKSERYPYADINRAVREFRAAVHKRRDGWVPPRRFRPAETGEALEERNPTTGVWSPTDVTRATMPATSMVEQRPAPWGMANTIGLVAGLIGIAPMLYGMMGGSAARDRR